MCHPGNRSNTDSSLVAITAVVSTHTLTLCGPPSALSILPRSTVSTESEIHLGRKVIPSACMEALMRHYKAAGFSDEVSRLAAAPRRPSTNCMYDDRWAAREGFDLLNPTAAQIAAFLYSLFDTHGLSPFKLSKAIELVWARCLTRQAKLKWFSKRLSPI